MTVSIRRIGDICLRCVYYSNPYNHVGSCWRYPTSVERSETDWCGEFTRDRAKAELTIKLPMTPVVKGDKK
jgi:hypothetical protein